MTLAAELSVITNDKRSPVAFCFGPFRLIPAERRLERSGSPVHLGARAFDILTMLVSNGGEVVAKRDILDRVWPETAVDDVSLRVRMAELRKALNSGGVGTRYLTTVQSQGYCFVATVTYEWGGRPSENPAKLGPRKRNLPTNLCRVVGREQVVSEICVQTRDHRLVSIVGAGGIGKSTVAISAISHLRETFEDGLVFIDLGQIVDTRLVESTIANAFGLSVESEDPVSKIINFLTPKHGLLVLDCCEHVIDAVANIVELIISATPRFHVLATSREAMNLTGEHIYRLGPLAVPPERLSITASEALGYPSVQLLVEKITASRDDFELGDVDAPYAAAICRRLDGVALAIELVAGHVDVFGLAGAAAGLHNQFGALINLRRYSIPRHQTIFAALDWSYNLLSPIEQSVGRALSSFVGAFTLEAARSVAAHELQSEFVVEQALAGLCAKSIVSVDISSATTYYRLLDTTRGYLSDKLFELQEAKSVVRRHAQYYNLKVLSASTQAPTSHDAEWFDTLNKQIGNIRAALEWTFSGEGDGNSAILLATSSAAIFVDMSLLTECLHWTRRALALLECNGGSIDQELELRIAFAISLMYTEGASNETLQNLNKALNLASRSGNPLYKMRLFGAFYKYYFMQGDLREALAIAQKNEALAYEINDPIVINMVHATLGLANHLAGQHNDAARHCELSMRAIDPAAPGQKTVRFDFDYRNAAVCAWARTSWVTGNPKRAHAQAEHALAWASTLQNPVVLCISLVWTISVNLMSENIDRAEGLNERLGEQAQDFSFAPYIGLSLGFRGAIRIRRGHLEDGIEMIQLSLQQLDAIGYRLFICDLLSYLAEAQAQLGRHQDALTTVAKAFEAVEAYGAHFILAELHRIKGAVALGFPESGLSTENCFLEAIDIARSQKALSWELRASIGLAKLLTESGRQIEASARLREICTGFEDDFTSKDCRAARDLLLELDAQSMATSLPLMPAVIGPAAA